MRGGILKDEKEKVKAWCKAEMDLGHDLGGDDLLDEYTAKVDDAIFELKLEEAQWAAFLDLP